MCVCVFAKARLLIKIWLWCYRPSCKASLTARQAQQQSKKQWRFSKRCAFFQSIINAYIYVCVCVCVCVWENPYTTYFFLRNSKDCCRQNALVRCRMRLCDAVFHVFWQRCVALKKNYHWISPLLFPYSFFCCSDFLFLKFFFFFVIIFPAHRSSRKWWTWQLCIRGGQGAKFRGREENTYAWLCGMKRNRKA